MLKKLSCLLIITILSVIEASAQSQSLGPISIQQNNQNPAKNTEGQSYKDKYSCESLKTTLNKIISQYQNQNIKNTGKQEHHWYDTFWDNTTNWLLVLFNFLLVVVTGLLVLYNYRLWKATTGLLEVSNKQWDTNIRQMMYTVRHNARALSANERVANAAIDSADAAKDSAQVAMNTMKHAQRAYVFIKQIIHNVKPDEDIGEIIIVLENTGETPTKKMVCNYDYCCFSGDIPNDFNYPDKLPAVYGIIGRKTTIDVKVLMPFSVFDDARTKKHCLYIYGWIDYDDVFPNTPRHRTESCYEVVISKDREFNYHIYGNYNGSDDECYRKPSPYTPPT